jgi:hypothetical protein
MSGSASSFEAHLEAWEARRLVGGRELDSFEHAATLCIGELLARARLPADTPSDLVEILRRHQNDAAGGLKALAQRFGVPVLEVELYRRCWRDVMDAAFDRLLLERTQAMAARGADSAKVRRFAGELSAWRDRLMQERANRERRREERQVEEARRQASEQRAREREDFDRPMPPRSSD